MAKKKKEKSKARVKAAKIGKAVEANTADMAHKIWLAGVGAYGKAYDTALESAQTFNKQSTELFDELVKRGEEIESDVRSRIESNETVLKTGQSVAKYAEAARDFQAQARDQFEARMDRMRELLGVKGLGLPGSKLAAKLDKLEDEVAETVSNVRAKAKARNADLKERIARLTSEIEAVAEETGKDIAKTTKKAASRTTKAVKTATAKPKAKKAVKAVAAAKDDLTAITGVGPALEKKLNAAGVTSYAQIAGLKKADIAALDEKIAARGRITRDEWVKQAKALTK